MATLLAVRNVDHRRPDFKCRRRSLDELNSSETSNELSPIGSSPV
jgi:hypothetical protein